MRIALLLLPILCIGNGCKHWITSEDRAASTNEIARLRNHVRTPDNLSIQVTRSSEQISVRWRERLSPPHPVTVRLLPSDSFGSVQPVVEARLNDGRVVPLVLDTGSPVNLLHMGVALKNSVPIADPDLMGTTFQGFGGFEPAYYGMIEQLSVGDMQFRHALTAIRTRTFQRRFLGMIPVFRWEGNLIGMSSLSKLKYLTIDYPTRSATFSARQLFSEPTNHMAARLPFHLEGMQILVDLHLPPTNHVTAVVDTGNDAPLMLPTNLVRELGYQQLASKGQPGKYIGLGGQVHTRTFGLPQIKLGSLTFTRVDVVTAPEDYPVSIGSGLLKNYRVTIDFRQKVIWLERGPFGIPLAGRGM
ncbi:MAG: retropepsin-like domain-containing protein [Candidatus Omnitrophica bacterium]|nr:retropepsin-like domain-containing protein [Candidatus Omnitrophota bacterium]